MDSVDSDSDPDAGVVVVGIDGGGTRTRVVAADGAGRVLAAVEGSSINLDDHDRRHASDTLARALEDLRRLLGRHERPFSAAFLALGGVLSETDRRAVHDLAVAAGVAAPERIGVHHDAFGALEGGLLGAPGAVVVAGTGSICFGRAGDGREAWCGNWGPLFGDEGSGYWLGREALRAVAHAHDGRGAPTGLERAVHAWLGIETSERMLHRIYVGGLDRAEIAGFAPTVLELVDAGDGVARQIAERGCDELARCVEVVHEQLFGGREAPVLVVGGLNRNGSWREAFRRAVARRTPAARFVEPALPPVLGAVRRALVLAGVDVDTSVDTALAAGGRALPASF